MMVTPSSSDNSKPSQPSVEPDDDGMQESETSGKEDFGGGSGVDAVCEGTRYFPKFDVQHPTFL